MFAVTPDWSSYAGHSRLVHAAWDALVEKDPVEVSLKDLASAAGTSPSTFHRRFATRSALFAEVANAGLATLLVNLADEPEWPDVVGAWIRFAEARPRHYALMFSPQFAEHPGVSLRRDALGRCVRELAERQLGRVPHQSHTYTLYAMVHGAAALVAAGRGDARGNLLVPRLARAAPLTRPAQLSRSSCRASCGVARVRPLAFARLAASATSS